MNKFYRTISLLLTASIILSSLFASMVFSVALNTAQSVSYIINAEEISLQNVGNCLISKNTVSCLKGNKHPAFNIALPGKYNIESIKITASSKGANYHIDVNGLQFYDGETKVESIGTWEDNYSSNPITKTYNLNEKNIEKNIDTLAFRGFWDGNYSTDSAAVLTIEKIEIIGKQTSEIYELLPVDFEMTAKANCKVEGNTVSTVAGQIYPQYKVKMSSAFSIEKISITATIEGENSITNFKGIQLLSGNDTVEALGAWEHFFNGGRQTTLTYSTSKNTLSKDIDSIYFCGAWLSTPSKDGDTKIKIDKVRIIGKKTADFLTVLPEDFSLSAKANCTIDGNTVSSIGGQVYPQYNLKMNSCYLIDRISITATIEGSNSITNFGGVQLISNETTLEALGAWDNFFNGGQTTTLTFSATEKSIGKEIDYIYFRGAWLSTPEKDGDAKITIDKIEIMGKRTIKKPSITFDHVTGSSARVSWQKPNDAETAEVYYSETEITEKNFDTVDKILAAKGDISSADISGLETGKRYYFAVKINGIGMSILSFNSVMPNEPVYDFDKSTNLADYKSKISPWADFYYINASSSYGNKGLMNVNPKYSDVGNSFEMKWDDTNISEWRWPMIYFYAPNYADYSGEGLSVTVAKTLNQKNENVGINCSVHMILENGDRYDVTNKGENKDLILFPKDINSQTIEYLYKDFSLSTDSTVKMTPEKSQYIAAFMIYFGSSSQEDGYFSLFFDSIRVLNPIKIHRPVECIEFVDESISLVQNQLYSQDPIFTPFNSTLTECVWTSDNEKVATVNPETGAVTTHSIGVARITATTLNGVKGTYKVIVGEDLRGVQFRDLYDFDNGVIPYSMILENGTATVDYVNSHKFSSLCLKSNGTMTATFETEKYAFYGEGLGIYTRGIGANSARIELITLQGVAFGYDLLVDAVDGFYTTLDYSLFKNSAGSSPSADDLVNLRKLRISYNGTLYVDSIRVKDPLVYNVKTYPENNIGDTKAVIKDNNNVLGDNKYYFSRLSSGSDYEWAIGSLEDSSLIKTSFEATVYSLYFLDGNHNEIDLKGQVSVTVPVPFNLQGLNNIWVFNIQSGSNVGVPADISGDTLTFATSKSGIYCIISGDGERFLTKKVKNIRKFLVEIPPEIKEEVVESPEKNTVKVMKRKWVASEDHSSFYILWVIIPLATVLITATVTTIVIIKKRRNKRLSKEA